MDKQIIPGYFEIKEYIFDEKTFTAKFFYSHDLNGETIDYCETIVFDKIESDTDFSLYSEDRKSMLDQALTLASVVIGTSYYKTWPTEEIIFNNSCFDSIFDILEASYHKGLSQFIFENHLDPDKMGHPACLNEYHIQPPSPHAYESRGILALQSGGKDSILTATILNEKNIPWTALYISSNESSYPEVINQLHPQKVQVIQRKIDKDSLKKNQSNGGLNGHVPVTYINMSLALIQAIINGDNQILTSIGHEGEEPHAMIGDLPVNHQWSKTWEAEQLFAKYVSEYISKEIKIGSPLRQYSELKIAELFTEKCCEKFGNMFSSCNLANYKQGNNNTDLYWCGKCAKCANSYLLFSPFIRPEDQPTGSLFTDSSLTAIFKGLLGVDNEIKPFECVGEIAELRHAYHMKMKEYPDLPFSVPESDYNYEQIFPHQDFKL